MDIFTWNIPTHLKFSKLQTKLIMSHCSSLSYTCSFFLFSCSPWLKSWGHPTAHQLHDAFEDALELSRTILSPSPRARKTLLHSLGPSSSVVRTSHPFSCHSPRTSGVKRPQIYSFKSASKHVIVPWCSSLYPVCDLSLVLPTNLSALPGQEC